MTRSCLSRYFLLMIKVNSKRLIIPFYADKESVNLTENRVA